MALEEITEDNPEKEKSSPVSKKFRYMCLAGIGAITIATGILMGCSPAPNNCANPPEFSEASEYVVRQEPFSLVAKYDIITGNNCRAGTITNEIFKYPRRFRIEANGEYIGKIQSEWLTLGEDMTVYDGTGNATAVIDHKLWESTKNYGGFYIEIKDSRGEIVGILKEEPFALFREERHWKYFEVLNPDNQSAMAIIVCESVLPDTYRVKNYSNMDNRTLAGLVAMLDKIEDDAAAASSSSSSSSPSD